MGRLKMFDTYCILYAGAKTSEEDLIWAHLSNTGHKLIFAASLAEAKEILKSRRIDLIYLQLAEGGRAASGLEEISGPYPSAPVVLVCPKATDGLILEAWRAGAADIIFPPLTPQSLDASIRRALKKRPSGELDRLAPTAARFHYLDESGKECRANIVFPRFTLGRSSANDLHLNHSGVSRFHAEIVIQDGEHVLRDMGSKYGTFVNGIQIAEAHLTDGDRVQLGSLQGTSLVFHKGDLLQTLVGRSDPNERIGLSIRGFKEFGKLFAAFRALSSIPLLDDLLALVVDTAIELTGTERGFIMLKEKNGELSFRCARNNYKRPLDGSCFQTSRRIPYEVFESNQPIVIKDLGFGDGTEKHDRTMALGLRSISCVPLRYLTVHDTGSASPVAQAETIGVLYLDSRNVGVRMPKSRINALETLASEAAMAIYNARLYKDSQDKRRMEEQLTIAREIQQALLPHPYRELEYFRACSQSLPCYEIGGDYFDYFNLENGSFGFALGDVAGKGLPAALLASLIQGIFSAQKLTDAPLAKIIGEVNRKLAQRGTGNRFVTFFFGLMDPDGKCTYVNAGHNPPLLLRREGSMQELTAGGMVLGLFSEASYEAGFVTLQPEDHLVLFTDGLVEALNAKGEEFGTDRLTLLLKTHAQSSAREILSCLQESVLSFSADTPQHDDITMMVLGYRE